MGACLQAQIFQQRILFRFRLGFFLLCLFFVCLMCWLGAWQIHRYHFKKNLLESYQQRLVSAPKPLEEVAKFAEQMQFQPVWIHGHYLNAMTMLVQNQYYQDKLGYYVLTPVQIPGDDKLLLVNRGWVPQIDRQHLPSIEEINGEQKIVGDIKLLNEYQFTLGQNILDAHAKQIVMQKIDIAEISRITHHVFYPFVLRLSATAGPGYVRDWSVTTTVMTPERHMAYAVQWFLMAFVLLIAYFCFSCERIKEDHYAK